MLTTLALIGGGGAVVAFIVWYALRGAKKRGIAEQVARDAETVRDAESQIHEVQAEKRETSKTKKRLGDGSF